ncbi:methyltransferase regulatory domain-containing protein [Helicobacter pylori]|nr:methyltransferase regulatory domain-containing protein [Helicobacter pylori]
MQNQFNNILSSNAKYLAHEYLNQSYESFDFAKLVAELSQAKLQFASPAHFARLLQPSYFLDKVTLNKLNETSPIMQEMLKDLFYGVGIQKGLFHQELQNALQDFEKDLPRLKKLGVIPKETKK